MFVVGEAIARRAHALDHRFGADGRGWIVWACFALLVLIARLDSTDNIENVISVYRDAGLRWLHGEDLYPGQFRFNYLPPSAVFFAAWNWLPFPVEGALWRIANIAVFALGLWRISALGEGPPTRSRFLLASLITIALSASAARYGQLTLAMSGLMMIAVADLEDGSLWRAAIFAALAVAMKPLAVVAWLTLVAVYPRLRWRAGIALAFLLLLPFVFQKTDYVWRQYAAVPAMLEVRANQHYHWQHIFGLLEMLGWVATHFQQMLIRGIGAAFVLYLSWRAKRHTPSIGAGLTLYALATCYILLLGSATERNTYAMLAPFIGLMAATAWETRNGPRLALMSGLASIMLLSHTLTRTFPHTVLATMKPFVCVMLFCWLVWIMHRSPAATGPTQIAPPRQPDGVL